MKEIEIGERYASLIQYNLQEGQAPLTRNNQVEIFTDGNDKFQSLLQELKAAKTYIHIQYYIIKNDQLWQEITSVLKQKAKAGVEVRIVFDSVGCRKMEKQEWENLKEAGVQVAEFFPVWFKKGQLRLNFRSHRKIVVIDGKVGFVGGFNIGKEYIGLDEKFGYWRDTHLKIEGDAVASLNMRFLLDWRYVTGENVLTQRDWNQQAEYGVSGTEAMQIISSGPNSRRQVIRDNYLQLIQMAKEHIYIQTPYFVPDEEVLQALKQAVASGVDVRIMIPCKPDHPLVYWATYFYIGQMIQAGAKCYLYENGFLHAKCVCVDHELTCTGTANMDIRSFRLNFEVNAMIYSEEITRTLEEAFANDLKESRLLTAEAYKNRGIQIKWKEQISRLFASLL